MYFYGIEVEEFKVISAELLKLVFRVDDLEREYYHTDQKVGNMIVRKEKEIAIEKLQSGKGILYNGKILFSSNCNSNSYKTFLEIYAKKQEQFSKSNLESYIKNEYDLPLVKTFIRLYKLKVIKENTFRQKMKHYLKDISYTDYLLE